MLITLYIQALLDGLMLGGLYAVIAVGLGLAFGVMRMVNFAHGECLMIAMYLANFLIMSFGMDPYLTIPITGSVMFLAGFLLQKGVFNRIIEKDNAREPQRVLLFTSGMGMVLTNGCILLFTSNTRMIRTAYSASSFSIGEFFFTAPRVIAFVIAMICTGGLYLFLQKSELGRALRAVSQNRAAAKLMGINEKFIYALAFGIGLGLGLVGISASVLVPFFPFSPNLGLIFGFKSFVIVVLGGLGSVPGALLGGLIVGVIEKVGGMLTTDVYAQAMLFLLFVGILLVKPSGLLGKEVE